MKLRDLLATNNPFHQEYVTPKICSNPKTRYADLLRFMLAKQKMVFGKTILDKGEISYTALYANIKRLCSEYSEEDITWGICAAISVCDFPFSTKIVKEILCSTQSPNQK